MIRRAMRKILIAGIMLGVFAQSARAFKDSQHAAASTLAVDNAGTVAPDIDKFSLLIKRWSFGVFPTPSEQLAHSGDQATLISDVKNNNGDFDGFVLKVTERYLLNDYAVETRGFEGAYVLMGTCLHLIEDQASPPHAANVIHSLGDNFEGRVLPQYVSVGFTGIAGAQVPFTQSYLDSLDTTQAKVPNLLSSSEVEFNGQAFVPRHYWRFNDEMRTRGFPESSSVRYHGEYNPANGGVDSISTGAYGGASLGDIFDHNETGGLDGLFKQQGTQAADYAFNFLLRISKSLRPIASGLAMSGAGGAPVVIDTVGGNQISFKIVENRTQDVDVDLIVDGDKKIITVGGSAKVSAAHSATGSEVPSMTPVDGNTIWNEKRISLPGTKADDFTLLPFEADFVLTWKGAVDGGAALTDGNHTLCVAVRDTENSPNSSPGVDDGRTDTCVRSASFSV